MRSIIIVLASFLIVFSTYAQEHSLTGRVRDEANHASFPGATVILKTLPDSTSAYGVTTTLEGLFNVPKVKRGKYVLEINFIGYKKVVRVLNVNKNINLGVVAMEEETTTLDAIEITAKAPVSTQKGDTTEFSAGAFKTTRDASAQDLVSKMPGIAVVDGQIQAQGEAVQKILIDGKPFFEGDVQAALQNLPSEVIAAIQVYDKKSDKAELSGFDDGEQVKTINIITKPDKRKGQFGKGSVGYGTDDRYQAAASVNLFDNDQRITITALSNNINMVNYSADPNSQGESRTQNGMIITNNAGINYGDSWDKVELTGGYYFSRRKNEGRRSLQRTYVLPSDSGQVYDQNSINNRINMDHHAWAKLEYELDDNNKIIWRPRISLRHDENNDSFEGETNTDNGRLNATNNTNTSKNSDYDFENNLFWSHQFSKKGRSITLSNNIGYHTNEDKSKRYAINNYYRRADSVEVLDQSSIRERDAVSFRMSAAYTEPLSKTSMLKAEYEIFNKDNSSDKLMYNNEDASSVLDTALSNAFDSHYLTHKAELGYQYKKNKWRMQLQAKYQLAKLNNDQQFPSTYDISRDFNSLLPSVRLDYELTDDKKLEFEYRTWTDAPSIGQLQAVIDNSNSLQLRTGNPGLEQAYNNWVRARYRAHSAEGNSMYASIESKFVDGYITNATTIANETTEIAQGIILEEGSQLIRPENTSGFYNFKTYVHYGMPWESIKSNIDVRGMVNYNRRPGVINNQTNLTNNTSLMLGLSLSSNISDRVDFNISTRGNYNIVSNSSRPAVDNEFYNQSTHVRYSWIFGNEFVYRADVNHRLNTGLAAGYDNSYTILNMSFGKKFLKDNLAELSVNVYDLLDQNNNVGRNVTEIYIEDSQSNALQRYFMLTFTYNLRHFSKGASMDDFKEI
ncbi:outer membrane beta-barrel protein [Fulvivirga sediminis]|uniref:Outer membrane beta-barrel protein n=1 Tax=Fulvivirga sediminis TaxID=2803949 RepID=A0A937F7S2_9BACT|nr:outer membrane beta-barrel protein [Fulvivirga sediminis]MBL3657891.1 outer membrane beta-barrel protein [Fulvivirga sediminis]